MNSQLLRKCVLALACTCAAPAAVQAQTVDDPVERARIQFGPLGLTPSVSLTNVGVDSNVFNTFDDPRRDFTFTFSPQVDLWFRAGRSRLAVASRADLVYFNRYASERSLDGDVDARWEIRGNRLTPWIGGGYSRGRQRVGYEIDVRSRRVTEEAAAGVELRVASKTRITVNAQRTKYKYDADALFFGTNLQEVLNHRTESAGVSYLQSLTVLTTFVVQADALRDRFDFSPQRNADSVRVQAGLDLGAGALIYGRGRAGFHKFKSVGGQLPPFSGLVASYAVGAAIKGRTRVEVSGERDIKYSYETLYPYYVLSGATVTVTPRLTDKWDVQGRLGAQWLAYRAAPGPAGIMPARTDEYGLLGGGVGFHLGRDIRIGFNVDKERRSSPLQSRDYKGYRIGSSVTYGR